MKKLIMFSALAATLAGCSEGTNPFEATQFAATDAETTEAPPTKDWIVSGDPDSNKAAGNTQDASNNFVFNLNGDIQSIRLTSYEDEKGDTAEILYVDNIPFDGITERPYVRDKKAKLHNEGTKLFVAEETITDPVSGTQISQLDYKAIYGISTSGSTEFAIVKSGSYIPEGFGGHVYQRNSYDNKDEYVRFYRPDTGQAGFFGKYDGFRVLTGDAYIDRTQGDVRLIVDFDDFNDRAAVRFNAVNRYATLPDGTIENLSPITSVIGSGTVDEDGTYSVSVFSLADDGTEDGSGSVEGFFAGGPPNEAVGILTMTFNSGSEEGTPESFFSGGGSFIETAGFFAYRDPN